MLFVVDTCDSLKGLVEVDRGMAKYLSYLFAALLVEFQGDVIVSLEELHSRNQTFGLLNLQEVGKQGHPANDFL